MSLVVTAHAPVTDVREALTPELAARQDSCLVLVDLGSGRARLGASALAQVTGRAGDPPPDLDEPAALAALGSGLADLVVRDVDLVELGGVS